MQLGLSKAPKVNEKYMTKRTKSADQTMTLFIYIILLGGFTFQAPRLNTDACTINTYI